MPKSNVFLKDGRWVYRKDDNELVGPFETGIKALEAYGHYCLEQMNEILADANSSS